jgi:hypothetical protein
MSDVSISQDQVNAAAAPTRPTAPRAVSITMNIAAPLFWLYVVCKLFIFDVDIFLIRSIDPSLIWITDYKFFLLIGLFALILLISQKSTVIAWTLFVLLYPFILVFWRIPKLVFKHRSWALAFALINTGISLFKSFRFKFVIATVFLIAIFIALKFSAPPLLYLSIFGIFAVLLASYMRMSIFVFQPSSIFRVYEKFVRNTPKFMVEHLSDAETRNLPINALDVKQIELRRSNIQTLVIGNRALLFVSRRLRDYQQSKLNAIAFTLNLFLLIVLTVISYGVINYALYKLDPTQFTIIGSPTFFLFVYYSFHAFIFGSIPEITPTQLYSQAISMSEQIFAIILLFILIGLFISVQSEKYKQELDRTIAETEASGRNLEDMINSTYNLSFEQALDEVRKMQNNLMTFILWLSQDFSSE